MTTTLFESSKHSADRLQEVEDTLMKQTILLKKLLSRLSEDERRQLNSFLSTIYGNAMVLQGMASITLDQVAAIETSVSTRRRMEWMAHLSWTLSEMLQQIQDLTEAVGEIT
jgi:hypothetical protein